MTVIRCRDRAHWLEERAKLLPRAIGASEVACVLGISPYGGPWDVWAKRRAPDLLRETKAEADIKAAGLDWEPVALDWALRQLGPGAAWADRGLSIHLRDGAVFASLDGLAIAGSIDSTSFGPPSGSAVVIEAKMTHYSAHGAHLWRDRAVVESMPADDEPDPGAPLHYLAQVQAQMSAASVDVALLVAVFGPFDVRMVLVRRDVAWWSRTEPKIRQWVDRHLIGVDADGWASGDAEPVPPDRDYSDACVRWSLSRCTEAERAATEAESMALADYIEAKQAEAQAAEAARKARADLAQMMSSDGARKVFAPGASATVSKAGVLSVRGKP